MRAKYFLTIYMKITHTSKACQNDSPYICIAIVIGGHCHTRIVVIFVVRVVWLLLGMTEITLYEAETSLVIFILLLHRQVTPPALGGGRN